MACSGRNILINGGFQKGSAPWTGKRIRRMKNPLRAGDYSMWMGATRAGGDSILKQTIRGPFERGCAYYLYFRLLNVTPPQSKAELYAAVAYLNEKRQMIRSTPLLIRPPYLGNKWYSYFTIVPSPPLNARYVSVVFLLRKGLLFVDYIRLASHDI
ncbi:hypothetical protein [Thermoactinomyces sp. CICC 10520]|jgi:hypothetical protein|uniref:hypothetical protein n=1 Tax=Thermoactinomyces sp. CICC 10520 TaxID=2767433 RepID=UPI0018DD0285|nr:hypothetical protein [Thermoactinomyces sp. CICC 10520]MBH8585034.1 hypothetical protein [Thermoactinomyces sp. CICC 10520]